MPMYLPMTTDGEHLGPALLSECLETADVEAHQLYGERLGYVVAAPKCIRPDDGRFHRSRFKAKPPSLYHLAKEMTARGEFDTPEWQEAEKGLTMTELDKILERHATFVRRRYKLAELGLSHRQ